MSRYLVLSADDDAVDQTQANDAQFGVTTSFEGLQDVLSRVPCLPTPVPSIWRVAFSDCAVSFEAGTPKLLDRLSLSHRVGS